MPARFARIERGGIYVKPLHGKVNYYAIIVCISRTSTVITQQVGYVGMMLLRISLAQESGWALAW
jgi:hypothetical protein